MSLDFANARAAVIGLISNIVFWVIEMSFIPTHGPECEKAHSNKTRCAVCYEVVRYIECTCKKPSRFYLNPTTGVEHVCIDVKRRDMSALLLRLIDGSRKNPEGSTKCPHCVEMIRNHKDNFIKHIKKCPKRPF